MNLHIGSIKRPTERLMVARVFMYQPMCWWDENENSLSEENKCESWNEKEK